MSTSFKLPDGDWVVELPEYTGYIFAVSIDNNRKRPCVLVAFKKPIDPHDTTTVVFECEAYTIYDLYKMLKSGMERYENNLG